MKHVIITGHSGFVGINLQPFLQKTGYTTLGVSRNPSEKEISYEALSEEIWDNTTVIIHLAGKLHYLKNKIQYA
ncbi:MAG: hypothetical protein CVU08_13990 [Bacteroidetes bacterium HGW-Bacteroidetes-3]|jgi:nucleoside-diphosphate-sugar epimerase|nr:MAG: hypothetical protein CVU08_13990 [Bacteroidetes bacterium HGW-Bacteroidetes-3]